MQVLANYNDWMRTGRLSAFVTARKSAGAGIKMFESVQPAGDMSDPANSSLVLVQVISDGLRQRSDLGGGKRESVARPGSFALCPPDFASDIEVFVPHHIRIFALEAEHFRAPLEDARPGRDSFDFGRLHDAPFGAPQLGAVVERMWADAADEGGGRLLAEAGALQLLAILARTADRELPLAKGGLAPWAERRVRDYLHAHFARDLSLAELAALAGLSPFHFTRMFKQSTGIPPYAYLRRLRVAEACRLLEAGDLPVIEVAAQVGYETPQAFARMFRAETGTSPSQWRRLRGMRCDRDQTPPEPFQIPSSPLPDPLQTPA